MAFQKWSAVWQNQFLKDCPTDEAPAFFAAFPDAVGRDGKDLSRVPWQFLAAELRELPPVENDIQAVIDLVIRGMKLLAEGKEWKREEAIAAASATTRAASAAAITPSAAAITAIAAAIPASEAAIADSDAIAAARAAARAASAAAWDAFRTTRDARCRQRDLLLKLISEAPVVALDGKQENNNG